MTDSTPTKAELQRDLVALRAENERLTVQVAADTIRIGQFVEAEKALVADFDAAVKRAKDAEKMLARRKRSNPAEIACGCLLCEKHLESFIVTRENAHFGIGVDE